MAPELTPDSPRFVMFAACHPATGEVTVDVVGPFVTSNEAADWAQPWEDTWAGKIFILRPQDVIPPTEWVGLA